MNHKRKRNDFEDLSLEEGEIRIFNVVCDSRPVEFILTEEKIQKFLYELRISAEHEEHLTKEIFLFLSEIGSGENKDEPPC